MTTTHISADGAAGRLERSVADALRVIAAACAEREAPPVHAARRRLAQVYGATRLRRREERRQGSTRKARPARPDPQG